MTEHDLSTLVRDHVSSDEPPFSGPEHVIARGRRTVRTRRLATGAGVAAVLVVAGAFVVPGLGDDPRRGGSDGTDPAVQEALESYDAQAMPGIIERTASQTFSRSVADLGESRFAAFDGNGTEIGPEHYDKASGMTVSYGGDGPQRLSVSLDHARGEVEGDHEKVCAEDLAQGYAFACTVETLANGDVVVTRVGAMRPFRLDGTWYAVTTGELPSRNPDHIWFQREAEVIKSDTFRTVVQEIVKAPTLAAAEAEFRVPADDLVALAADPTLVLPKPPADEIGGCPQWILPGSGTSCGG